jgi:hypothetical protein
MLTGFAAYDALACCGHSQDNIVAMLSRLVHFALT